MSTLPEDIRERIDKLQTVQMQIMDRQTQRYKLNEVLSQTDYDALFAILEEAVQKACKEAIAAPKLDGDYLCPRGEGKNCYCWKSGRGTTLRLLKVRLAELQSPSKESKS